LIRHQNYADIELKSDKSGNHPIKTFVLVTVHI